MSELTLLEKQSRENVLRIHRALKIPFGKTAKLTTLSLNAALFSGHLDLKDFRSVENIYIFKPYYTRTKISCGITSLDLSGNKDIKELYFGTGAVPKFKMITLAHSNQIENFYYDDPNIIRIFTTGTKEAFCRNMLNKINAEPNKNKRNTLELLLRNYLHILNFNNKEDKNYQDFLMSQFLKRFGQNVLA